MKTYEITFISKENLAEKTIQELFKDFSVKIITVNSLGEKQLAYKIKKEVRGFYTSVIFEIEPEKLQEINKKFALNGDLLRFLIVNFKPAVIAPTPEMKPKKVEVAPKEPKLEVKKTTKVRSKAAPKVEKPQEEENPEDRLKALDKKLDELLKE